MNQQTSDTETRVTIRPVEGSATALLCIYPNQTQPQATYIALDLRDGQMWADYDAEIGNAIPVDVWNGIVRRYPIPVLQPATVNALMEEIRPYAERVVAGAEIRWDGSNHVARLNGDAQIAEAHIDAEPYLYRPEMPVAEGVLNELDSDVYTWEAAEWLAPVEEVIVQQFREGTATVESLAAEYQGDGSSEETPYVPDLEKHLEILAREAQDEEA